MLTIDPALALRIARRVCDRHNVALVLPGAQRDAVMALVILVRSLEATGDDDALREGTTVTLPGAGPALALLALVPYVGATLARRGADLGRTAIYLSPAALRSGDELLRVLWHELGHVGAIAQGGLGWCFAYLIAAEVRAGGEAPCYGAGMAVAVALGADVDVVAEEALRSLAGYALDEPGHALAAGIIASAAATIRATGDLGGVCEELRAELAVEGVVLS